MTTRNQSFDEAVRSQHDARVWADRNGALVQQETGKYYRVATEKGAVHLNDCCRTMPKCERNMVKFWFFCLGLPVTVIALAVITAPYWMPVVMGA